MDCGVLTITFLVLRSSASAASPGEEIVTDGSRTPLRGRASAGGSCSVCGSGDGGGDGSRTRCSVGAGCTCGLSDIRRARGGGDAIKRSVGSCSVVTEGGEVDRRADRRNRSSDASGVSVGSSVALGAHCRSCWHSVRESPSIQNCVVCSLRCAAGPCSAMGQRVAFALSVGMVNSEFAV